jgi:hypothetical protein
MNTLIPEGLDSMRIDIPKDYVLLADQRVEGKDYPMLGFLDPRPVSEFYWRLVTKAAEKKRR